MGKIKINQGIIVFITLISLIFAFWVPNTFAEQAFTQYLAGYSDGDAVRVRKKPDPNSALFNRLYFGDLVCVIGKSRDWYKILKNDYSGKMQIGFVYAKYIKFDFSIGVNASAEAIKIHKNPSYNSKAYFKVDKGDNFITFWSGNGWYKGYSIKGSPGYVPAKSITITNKVIEGVPEKTIEDLERLWRQYKSRYSLATVDTQKTPTVTPKTLPVANPKPLPKKQSPPKSRKTKSSPQASVSLIKKTTSLLITLVPEYGTILIIFILALPLLIALGVKVFPWVKNHTVYLIIPVVLCGVGFFLVNKHLNKPPPPPPEEQTYWKLTIPKGEWFAWPCKANISYQIKSDYGFLAGRVNGKEIPFQNISGKHYTFTFEQDTDLRLKPKHYSGLFSSKDGQIEVWKGRNKAPKFEFIYLQKDIPHEDFVFHLNKGEWLRVVGQKEKMWMLAYKEGKGEPEKTLITDDYNTRSFPFYYPTTVKFMAAELPFPLEKKKRNGRYTSYTFEKYTRNLKVNDKSIDKELFFVDGEEKTTKIWLGKNDSLSIDGVEGVKSCFQYAIGNDSYRNFEDDYYDRLKLPQKRRSEGYLKLKSDRRCNFYVTKINLSRGDTWKFDLDPNEEASVTLNGANDLISFTGKGGNYYIGNNLYRERESYSYRSSTANKKITFKASVEPVVISVSVKQRRGI